MVPRVETRQAPATPVPEPPGARSCTCRSLGKTWDAEVCTKFQTEFQTQFQTRVAVRPARPPKSGYQLARVIPYTFTSLDTHYFDGIGILTSFFSTG